MRAMLALTLAGIVVAALAFAVNARGRHSSPALSETEALAALASTVELAQSGRFDELCARAGGHESACRWWLERAGWREAPIETPMVLETARLGPNGWLLTLCGRTASGLPYETGFAVYREEADSVDIPYPVYWSGLNVAGAGGVLPNVPQSHADTSCPA
jgi:hypothetical protein